MRKWLLVGTSTSKQTNGAKLEIVGTRASNGIYEIALHEDGIHPLMTFSRGAALVSNGFGLGEIGFYGHDGTDKDSEAARIVAVVDGTPGANDMPARIEFHTTADGAASPTEAMRINNQREVLIGTATRNANGGVLQLKSGITFPATAVAATDVNTLDDYEEGTWTPTVFRTGSSYVLGDNSNGYRTGKYVKIGNAVYCWFSLSINTITTQGTGANDLSGLPFASSGGTFARFSGGVSVCTVLTTATSLFLGGNGGTTAVFANQTNEGLSTTFTTGNVFGFISYQSS